MAFALYGNKNAFLFRWKIVIFLLRNMEFFYINDILSQLKVTNTVAIENFLACLVSNKLYLKENEIIVVFAQYDKKQLSHLGKTYGILFYDTLKRINRFLHKEFLT